MKTNRLRAYGSTALSTTALLASHSDAATVVDINANTYDTQMAGIGIISRFGSGGEYTSSGINISTAVKQPMGSDFRRGTDSSVVEFEFFNSANNFNYTTTDFEFSSAVNGAQLNSSDNWFYAKQSNGSNAVWLQFQFGGSGDGTGFSIIKAVVPSTPGELTTASAASSVPEPSSMALLALGASGLLIRRRQKAA